MSETNGSNKLWQSCSLYNAEYIVVISFPSLIYYINHIIGLICNIVLMILAISLNSATIFAYWRSPRLKNKSSYFLIMFLSLTDLITAVFGHSVYVVTLVLTISGNQDCRIHILHEMLTFCTSAMSFSTLLTLNIERYVSVIHPFFHRTKITKLRTIGLTASSWLTCCAVTLLYPILGDVARELTTVMMSLSILMTMYIYLSIFLAIRKTANSPLQGNQPKTFQNLKMTKSCAIIVVCTVVCYLPYAVIRSLPASIFVTMLMEIWSKTLALVFPSLDSLVFFWKNPVLRKEAKEVFKNLRTSCM